MERTGTYWFWFIIREAPGFVTNLAIRCARYLQVFQKPDLVYKILRQMAFERRFANRRNQLPLPAVLISMASELLGALVTTSNSGSTSSVTSIFITAPSNRATSLSLSP